MKRLLVIPAAGRGTRLGWNGPKVFFPVAGRPMIDHLFERYQSMVDAVVVVLAPAAMPWVQAYLDRSGQRAELVIQPEATGMLPAVLCARSAVERHLPDYVWITWCDQIGLSARTVQQLAEEIDRRPDAALVFPTVRQAPPYIHYRRDAAGRICDVLRRRDGHNMPAVGESDAGLFALRRDTYLESLVEYDRDAMRDQSLAERNFLPFIPWLAQRAVVVTFTLADAREAVGVNTPDDVRHIEALLDE